MLTDEALVAGFEHLPAFGRRGRDRARALWGASVRIVHRPAVSPEAAVCREDAVFPAPAAPDLRPGDTWILPLSADPARRADFVAALRRAAVHLRGRRDVAVAPVPEATCGPLVLWAVTAARLLLPNPVRVAARFDVLGNHVAQTAIAFGADTLEGPVTAERSLPLAGVFRPTETSRPALEALVRFAGATPEPPRSPR